MTTVYVLTETSRWGPAAFSSKEKLLEYYQGLNPHAKHLRVKEYDWGGITGVLNHNTHVTLFNDKIRAVVLDAALEE